MFIQNYETRGRMGTTFGGADYSDFTISFPCQKNSLVINPEQKVQITGLNMIFDAGNAFLSVANWVKENLAIGVGDFPTKNGKYIIWKTDLSNGYTIGCTAFVYNNGTAFNSYTGVYGKTSEFDSILYYMSDIDGTMTEQGTKKFKWLFFTQGGATSDFKSTYVIYLRGGFQNEEYSGICYFKYKENQYPVFHTRFSLVLKSSDWRNFGDIVVTEFDNEYGNASGSGGYGGGSFDNSSDAFGVPQLPSVGVTTTGFINVYNPTLNQLQGFAEDLFPDISSAIFDDSGTLEAVANNVKAVGETMKSFADCFINQNLIQYVIDCHIIPCVPSIKESTGLKVGFKTFNYNPAKVTSDYVTVNCGTLNIKEYYQNFLDYVGTKAKLYLPFVGFVDVKNEWFQDGFLKVEYHYNVIDGSFMAFILSTSSKSKLTDTIVASYGGNACVHIPITGTNYSSMIAGVVQGTSKAISSLTHANPSGLLEGGMNVLQAKPSVEQSNSYNSNSAFMGVRKPYLIIERPVASFSKNYPHEEGLPLNVSKKLSDVKGFTVCENIITDSLSCTFKEKEMIKSLFKDGVIM